MSTRNDFIAQAYLKWRLPLFRLLKHRLRDEAAAEDAAQESFARWLASRAEALPDNPKAYVTRIALNAIQESPNERLSKHHVEIGPDGESDDYGAAPAEQCPQRQAENRQTLARLEQALQELPDAQREAFVLHRFDGLTYDAIAAHMQISRALVSRHISRAVAYCRLRVNYPSAQAMHLASSMEDVDHEA